MLLSILFICNLFLVPFLLHFARKRFAYYMSSCSFERLYLAYAAKTHAISLCFGKQLHLFSLTQFLHMLLQIVFLCASEQMERLKLIFSCTGSLCLSVRLSNCICSNFLMHVFIVLKRASEFVHLRIHSMSERASERLHLF